MVLLRTMPAMELVYICGKPGGIPGHGYKDKSWNGHPCAPSHGTWFLPQNAPIFPLPYSKLNPAAPTGYPAESGTSSCFHQLGLWYPKPPSPSSWSTSKTDEYWWEALEMKGNLWNSFILQMGVLRPALVISLAWVQGMKGDRGASKKAGKDHLLLKPPLSAASMSQIHLLPVLDPHSSTPVFLATSPLLVGSQVSARACGKAPVFPTALWQCATWSTTRVCFIANFSSCYQWTHVPLEARP